MPLQGVKRLELEIRTELSKRPTLFWAGATVTTRDGKQIPLSQLPLKFDNIVLVNGVDVDYLGGPVKIGGKEFKNDVPAEPADTSRPGDITIDLTSIDAIRLTAVVGSDYPPGDESQRRKTYAVRSQGVDATFLTLIEPYEDRPMVKSALATGASSLSVELTDGGMQRIEIKHLDGDGKNLGVNIQEIRGDQILRTESCDSATSNP